MELARQGNRVVFLDPPALHREMKGIERVTENFDGGALEVVRLCWTIILGHRPLISTFALSLSRVQARTQDISALSAPPPEQTTGSSKVVNYLLHVSFSLPPIKLLPCRSPTPTPL